MVDNQECVGCGSCCMTGPCGYGEWDDAAHQCKFLKTKEEGPDFKIYVCGKYNEIKDQPGADMNPAFGAGCCSIMFNTRRGIINKAINEGRIQKPYLGG